ncbi:MAG: hypothetical protein ACD_75C02624G0002 [uncultured bacterium]|nr:MAG: hypothetical protein ACD_75C02624G0002 [uncultured bacterium]
MARSFGEVSLRVNALDGGTVKTGKLSDVQLEAITAAGQAHQDILPSGAQRGFFIGDGTGVGKGREIAGILWDLPQGQ